MIIHEATNPDALRAQASSQTLAQVENIIALHTTPEEAGDVFSRIKPRLAVYAHAGESQNLIARTRKTYSGPLESGDDMMTIEIGEKIDIHRFSQ